jgi:hypothetical protein
MKDEQAKQRMKRFQELPSNTISWETFKRKRNRKSKKHY